MRLPSLPRYDHGMLPLPGRQTLRNLEAVSFPTRSFPRFPSLALAKPLAEFISGLTATNPLLDPDTTLVVATLSSL